MSIFQSEYELRVSFEDLDPMNIVWHGNYMRYLEQARCDMFNKIKYNYIDMQKEGVAYPVAKMQLKYIKPAQLNDILVVKSEILSIEPSLDIKYIIYNKESKTKIFEAKTMQILIDLKTRQSNYSAPKRLAKALGV